jgi:hypothetical protein
MENSLILKRQQSLKSLVHKMQQRLGSAVRNLYLLSKHPSAEHQALAQAHYPAIEQETYNRPATRTTGLVE